MKTRLLSLILLAVIAVTSCSGKREYPEAPPYVKLPTGEFPIVATYAFYDPYVTDQQYEWVKEAGFNIISKVLSFPRMEPVLEMARKHDLRMLGGLWEMRDTVRIVEGLKRYAGNPAMWGYSLADEPNASKFEFVRALRDSVLKYTPDKSVYINLFPKVGSDLSGKPTYREYVEDYVRTVNPPYLSVDTYPVVTDKKGNPTVQTDFHYTMEVIRSVSRDSGRPFWSFILSNKHWGYAKPTVEGIRFQVFMALGYGAQGLLYFTYMPTDFDKDNEFTDFPIDRDGKRTDTWYMVKEVNEEVRALTDVFLGAEVLDVSYAGTRIPPETRRAYRLPAPFRGVEAFGAGVMLSHLKNGEKEYLLLVNQDVVSHQRVRLSRTRPVTRLYGDGARRKDSRESFSLEPGGFALFEIN